MASSSQLIIKSYTPFMFWLKVGLITCLSLVVAWLAYSYGSYRSGYDNVDIRSARDRFAKKIDTLEQFNRALREKNATLEQASRVNKSAYSNVDSTIKDLQNEILELKQQVAFYRGIIAPTESTSGLSVAELEFRTIGESGGYHYKLVLTQTRKKVLLVKGTVHIYINGLLNGAEEQLSVSVLTKKKKTQELNLDFKYFQTLEGDVVLPTGFVPSGVIIDLKPTGKGYSRVKKNYDWADIIL